MNGEIDQIVLQPWICCYNNMIVDETICISVQVQVSSAETRRHDEIVAGEDCASPMMSEQYRGEEQTIPKFV